MWAKLSSALKQRPSTPSLGNHDDQPSHTDVLASVYEQHPNLSVFHQESEIPFPSPSPPASPSINGRKGIFKRPRPSRIDTSEPASSSPQMSPLLLPKKVKSSLQPLSSASELSLNRSSLESTQRPLEGATTQDKPPNTPAEGKFGSLRSVLRPPSQDSTRSTQDKPPVTPVADIKFSSVRSILRDPNTPATGQSVRFFSRDAYRVISPDSSATSSEPEQISFAARLHRAKQQSRPAAQEVFSAPTTPSLLTQVPPPNMSNIFDLSTDVELPTIPQGTEVPLLDSAVEISKPDDAAADHKDEHECPPTPPAKTSAQHDRSHSFSFGQTVFRSVGMESSPVLSPTSVPKANRNRALSDTIFRSFAHSPASTLAEKIPPEADINDTSAALVVYASPEREKEKDPFGAHATTYYTPGTMIPPTPPQPLKEGHARKASREEDLIWSLRTQLALQSELCVQFEVDLGARDELVRVLNARLEESERECERRKGVVKSWRKRVAELEKCVRGLQEEVDHSREESMERSVMDEASGEALRMLHRRIEALEREKTEEKRRENQAHEEAAAREQELQEIQEELAKRDQSERELKAGITAAKEEMEQMGDLSETQEAIARQALAQEEAERQHLAAEAAWNRERNHLLSGNEDLQKEQAAIQAQLTDARKEVVRKEMEISVLKAEVEAQWKHTEGAGEKIHQLEREGDEMKAEVGSLNERIAGMEVDWSQIENRKAELEREIQEVWAAKEEIERERNELEDQLHAEQEHSENLTQALQEREDRVTILEQERQYGLDKAARLEAQIKQRDADAAEPADRATAREREGEAAQEEMGRMKREHARIVNEQSRTLQDVVAREVEARAGMEALVREKAEADVYLASLKEKLTALQDETERLRRQVHALQQESADKEVRLVNLQKQRVQDKDHVQGLNIALDSKQQELELLKRRIGVRVSSGGTPAQAAKPPHHRRESSIFGTPSVGGSRPPSALSDVESTVKQRKLSDTPTTVIKAALAKSVRANGTGPSSTAAKRSLDGAMGPPRALPTTRSSSATPTRIPSSSRTSAASGVPSAYAKPTSATQRRMSASSATEPSRLRTTLVSRESFTSASESDEKEKENTAPGAKARRVSVLAA